MPAFSIVTETTLLIEGRRIPTFQSISIQQSIHDTHQFKIAFEHDNVEELRLLFTDQFKSFHRKAVEITIQGDKRIDPFKFDGIITQVEIKHFDDGYWGNLVLIGHGHCEALMHVPGTQRFWEKSVQAIVNATLIAYNFPKKITPPAGPSGIPYCVRYNETSWNFLKRLAYDFGAWFYYDGTTLHFTTNPGTAPLGLTFGANLTHFQMGVRAQPTYFKHIDYLPTEHKILSEESIADKAPYNKPPTNGTVNPRPAQVSADMTPYRKNRHNALGAESAYMEGKTEIPSLFPGRTITVTDSKNGTGGTSAPYIVTTVVHYITGVGQYHNRFKAIPNDTVAMPIRNLKRPVAETQLGEVVDNKDPKSLGRVKVQLHWMEAGESTPFIRVVAPHFGTYGDGSKTRGFRFVPEIDDQVMVGFEHNNPERPFVIGAMPHFKNSSIEGSEADQEKHISVKSGSTLTFIEKPALKEIYLQVDPKNFVKISVPNGPGSITIQSSRDIIVKAQAKVTIEAPQIELEGQQISIKGQDVKIEGTQVSIDAKANLNLKGAMTDIEGTATMNAKSSGITTVKGSMVMIN